MQKYRCFLLVTTLIGLAHGMLLSIAQPRISVLDITPFSEILITHGPLYWLFGATLIAEGFLVWIFGLIIGRPTEGDLVSALLNAYVIAFAFSFMFRYLVLIRPQYISKTVTVRHIKWLFALIFVYCSIFTGHIILMQVDLFLSTIKTAFKATNEEFIRYRRLNFDGIQVGLAFAPGFSLFASACYSVMSTLNLVFCYGIIAFCGFKVYWLLQLNRF